MPEFNRQNKGFPRPKTPPKQYPYTQKLQQSVTPDNQTQQAATNYRLSDSKNKSSSRYLSSQQLFDIASTTRDQQLSSLLKFCLKYEPYHQLIEIKPIRWDMSQSNPQASLGFLEHSVEVQSGTYYPAFEGESYAMTSPSGKPLICHLNVGSFGLDISHTTITEKYYDLAKKLVNYIDKHKAETLVFNFQDIPQEEQLFDEFRKRGFDVVFIPMAYFGEGILEHRKRAGIVTLINKRLAGYQVAVERLWVEYHAGSFPRLKNYQKSYKDTDHLQISPSLFVALKSENTNYLVGNTYMSAFSTEKTRAEVTDKTLSNFRLLHDQLRRENLGNIVIARFTGDFNPYGTNTLKGPLGMSGNPYSFLKHAIYGLWSGFRPWKIFSGKLFITGKNPFNERESAEFIDLAKQNRLRYATNSFNQKFVTMSMNLQDFAPRPVKFLFKGSGIDWHLDFCFYPEYEGLVYAYTDIEPYGDYDHKTLFVES